MKDSLSRKISFLIPETLPGLAVLTWIKVQLIFMVALLLLRGLYIGVYQSYLTGVTWGELVMVFLVGLRFDLSTTLLTISLPMLPLWFPWGRRLEPFMIRVSLWLTSIFLIVACGFLWSDLLFYGESGHHLTVEPAGVLPDIGPMLVVAVTEYPLPLLGLIVFCIVLVRIIRRQFRPLLAKSLEYKHSQLSGPSGRIFWHYPATLILIASATIVGIRGGVQREPLKSSDAVMTNSYFAGNLSLNGWYSFLSTVLLETRAPMSVYPDSVAIARTRALVAGAGDTFESDDYPLLRKSVSHHRLVASPESLNVVVILVESLNASYLRSFGGPVSVMPFLDSLAQSSLIFTNCNSIATRSFRAVCAVFASVPNLGGSPYAITFTLPKLRGMGELFTEQGYQVRFMHAAAPGSMGVMAISRMAGYQDFVSSKDFPKEAQNGSWGVWDHLALQRMSEDMDHMREPLHYGIFTLCTHSPWSLPEGFKPPFPSSVPDAVILNTYAYLDTAFREFFRRESMQPRFKHTLYVIVGDHTTHATDEERFRIGCLFYAPGHLEPGVDNRVMCQLDVMPTILDLTGMERDQACFGRSMFDPDTVRRFAVMTQSNLLEWRHGNRTFVSDVEKDIALFDPDNGQGRRLNLLSAEPHTADSLRRDFQSFYQATDRLIRGNRIYPKP